MPTSLATVFLSATLALPGATPYATAVGPAAARATVDKDPPLLHEQPGATTGDEATRSAAARKHYAGRRYREAAQLYEQLWRSSKAPKYLFNAGMARAAAEHDGAAIVHWQAYLAAAPGVSAGERRMLEAEITAARARTLSIQLRVQGPLAPATLTLAAPDGAPQGPRDPLELVPAAAIDLSLEAGDWIATLRRPDRPDAVARFRVGGDAEPIVSFGAEPPAPLPLAPPEAPAPAAAELTLHLAPARALTRGATIGLIGPEERSSQHVRDATTTWRLPPGIWRVRVDSPGRAPTTGSATLGPGDSRSLTLHLRRDRAAQVRLGLGLGLGGAGLVFVTAGSVVAARSPRHLECSDRATCSEAADALLTRSIGLSLLGTGLGAAVPAVTAAFARRDRALVIEAGVGGALLVGGLAWYLGEVTRTTAIDAMGREQTAATVLGLGGGMLGGAAIALVVRRLTRGRPAPVSLAPSLTPHTRGLALQARF